MKITGIRLENVRVFEGEHFIPIDDGLTVLIGRNNAGKSTVLQAPFTLSRQPVRDPETLRRRAQTSLDMAIALQLEFRRDTLEPELGLDPKIIRAVRSRHRELVDSTEFIGWEDHPCIELGHRWPGAGGSTPVLRLAAGDAPQCFEWWGDNSARVRFAGVTSPSQVNVGALAEAVKRAPAEENSGNGGPLIAYWEHHCVSGATDWIFYPGRRLRDSSEKRLQEVLTFLRLKHSKEFDRVSAAVSHALPEFARLDFIDTQQKEFHYRPGFVATSGVDKALARESVGSGAWAYLCILTAARAAKATGAKIIFLDEPHLYMHPGLERLLICELLDPGLWDGEPLQIVAATHSPTFVNYAVEHGTLNVLDWKDKERKSAKVETVRHGDSASKVFASLVSEPGDILYAERIVFVEGPSDVAALRVLARERCGVKRSIRYVSLRETDAVGPDIAKFFSIVVQAGGAGTPTRALLLLDGDKRALLEKKWEKAGAEDPHQTHGLDVLWSNPAGNDLESVFCDEAFLVAYFLKRCVEEGVSRPVVKAQLKTVALPATKKAEKGCVAIRKLHAELLREADDGVTKADDLESLMRFYVASIGEVFTKGVEAAMKPIEDAIRALGGQRVG